MKRIKLKELKELLKNGCLIERNNFDINYKLVEINENGGIKGIAVVMFKQFIKLDLKIVKSNKVYTYYKLNEVSA